MEVADVVDERGIDPVAKLLRGQVEVADVVRQLGAEKEAQILRRQGMRHAGEVILRQDEGPPRFGHLLPAHGQEAVHENPRRQLEIGGFQHYRPEQRVKIDDILADEMNELR